MKKSPHPENPSAQSSKYASPVRIGVAAVTTLLATASGAIESSSQAPLYVACNMPFASTVVDHTSDIFDWTENQRT